MMSPFAIAIVELGFHIHEQGRLHPDLQEFLTDIDALCGLAGGDLYSRQVVALAVVTWQRLNPDKKAVL